MPHIKHLDKVGNTYAISLDKALLDVLDIDEKTPLRVEVSTAGGNQIIITPIGEQEDSDPAFEKAFKRAFDELRPVMHRLPEASRDHERRIK